MKLIFFFLMINLAYCQSGIVVAGKDYYTVGAGLVQLQIPIIQEHSLSVPKFEIPTEKPIVKPKKKSLLQSILDFIKKLISKK